MGPLSIPASSSFIFYIMNKGDMALTRTTLIVLGIIVYLYMFAQRAVIVSSIVRQWVGDDSSAQLVRLVLIFVVFEHEFIAAHA